MKEYTTLTDLKNDFVNGKFGLDNEVRVNGNVYRNTSNCTNHNLLSMVNENAKGVVVYEGPQETDWIVFLWGAYKNSIIPYDVRKTSRPILQEDGDITDRIIADKVEVHFVNLPVASSITAKVDTGAEMCSLHAQDINIDRGQRVVSFFCPQLSKNKFTIPLEDQQAVKTSGQTTYRPVIKATLKIKGKLLKDILINLNDRSDMNDPMLLGQNALQAGKFLVDPSIMKEASSLLTTDFFNALQFDTVTPPEQTVSDETVKKLYEALENVGDISVNDLIKLLRTQVLKNLNEVQY